MINELHSYWCYTTSKAERLADSFPERMLVQLCDFQGEHLVGRLVCIPFHAPCFLSNFTDRQDIYAESAFQQLGDFLKKGFSHSGEMCQINQYDYKIS